MRKKISKHTISLNAVKTNPGLDRTISCQPSAVLWWLPSRLDTRILWNEGKNIISEPIVATVHSVIWNVLDSSLFLIDLTPCLTGVGRRCSYGHRDYMGDTTPSLLALPLFSWGGCEMLVCLELFTLINKAMAPEYDKLFILIPSRQPSWALTAICLLVMQLLVAKIIKLLPSGRGDHRICPCFSLQGKRSY